jgi:hypothetical protein
MLVCEKWEALKEKADVMVAELRQKGLVEYNEEWWCNICWTKTEKKTLNRGLARDQGIVRTICEADTDLGLRLWKYKESQGGMLLVTRGNQGTK